MNKEIIAQGFFLNTNLFPTWIWGKMPFSWMSGLFGRVLLLWVSMSRSTLLYVGAKGHFWSFRHFY